MDESSRRILVDILARCREELVDRATDWLRERAVEPAATPPRAETRALVDRTVAAQTAALVDGDEAALDAFLDGLTALQAPGDRRVSTLLRGMLSFRRALADVLRREVADGWAALEILSAVDEVAHGATLRAADLHTDELHRTVAERRAELEELTQLTLARQRELDEKIDTIAAQRDALSAMAAPVIRVWESVLVVPLTGEIDALRADVIREKVLQAVVATRARVVLVEITGLGRVDEQVASEVLRLVGCVRLLGSSAMLVGVSPEAALVLTNLDVHMDDLPSFTSLHDALRSVIEEAEAQRPARSRRTPRARA